MTIIEDPEWRDRGYTELNRPQLPSGSISLLNMTEEDVKHAKKKRRPLGFAPPPEKKKKP